MNLPSCQVPNARTDVGLAVLSSRRCCLARGLPQSDKVAEEHYSHGSRLFRPAAHFQFLGNRRWLGV
jgi:hypothetical protein